MKWFREMKMLEGRNLLETRRIFEEYGFEKHNAEAFYTQIFINKGKSTVDIVNNLLKEYIDTNFASDDDLILLLDEFRNEIYNMLFNLWTKYLYLKVKDILGEVIKSDTMEEVENYMEYNYVEVWSYSKQWHRYIVGGFDSYWKSFELIKNNYYL